MTPIKNWDEPDIPESLLETAITIFDGQDELMPAMFALLYFNDKVPQNKVIKLRKSSKVAGNVMAISEGSWEPNMSLDFYETLDAVLHLALDKFIGMAMQQNVVFSDVKARVDAHNELDRYKKQRQYMKVLKQKKYKAPKPLSNIGGKPAPIQLIHTWDDLAKLEYNPAEHAELFAILEDHFHQMTKIIDGDTTKGKLFDYKAKQVYPKVVRMLYFDVKTPEHRVIKLRNIAVWSGAVQVMENGAWKDKNQRDFLPRLYEVVEAVLSQVYNTLQQDAETKMEGVYSLDNYLLTEKHLQENKSSHRELKTSIMNVIMAGDSRDVPKPVRARPPPPMRLAKKEDTEPKKKSIAEYRKEIAALPKDGKEMARLRPSAEGYQMNE